MLICRVCATNTHKKHDITDIKDSVKELESKIPKYLNSKIDNYLSNTTKLDEGIHGYKAEVEATVKTILEQGKAVKELVALHFQAGICLLLTSHIKRREKNPQGHKSFKIQLQNR